MKGFLLMDVTDSFAAAGVVLLIAEAFSFGCLKYFSQKKDSRALGKKILFNSPLVIIAIPIVRGVFFFLKNQNTREFFEITGLTTITVVPISLAAAIPIMIILTVLKHRSDPALKRRMQPAE